MATTLNLRILREKEAFGKAGLKHATGWKRISDGLFPRPIKLGGVRASGWLEHEVDAAISAMAAGKQPAEIKNLVTALAAQRSEIYDGHVAGVQRSV